jgi:hypothetical protein
MRCQCPFCGNIVIKRTVAAWVNHLDECLRMVYPF